MGSAELQCDLWSQAPEDWAKLQEPLHKPLWQAILAATGTGQGTKLLDAGCGAGGMAALAIGKGADVSGFDAAEALIAIARDYAKTAEFRVGDLEELPYSNECFDVTIAANSVQYAGDPVAALGELRRVTNPTERIAVAVWGQAENCEFRHILKAVADAMPEPPKGGGPFALSVPGALEKLLSKADIEVDGRGEVACPFHYPDLTTAWRATACSGPLQGAMRTAGGETVKTAVLDAFRKFVQRDGSVRLENSMLYVTATR